MAGPDFFSHDHLYVSYQGCLPGWIHRTCLYYIANATAEERSTQSVIRILSVDLQGQGVFVPFEVLRQVLIDFNRPYNPGNLPDLATLQNMQPHHMAPPYDVLSTGPELGMMPRAVSLQSVLAADPAYQRYAGIQPRSTLFGPPPRGAMQDADSSRYPSFGGANPLTLRQAPANNAPGPASPPPDTPLDADDLQLAGFLLDEFARMDEEAEGQHQHPAPPADTRMAPQLPQRPVQNRTRSRSPARSPRLAPLTRPLDLVPPPLPARDPLGRRRTPPRNLNLNAANTYDWVQTHDPISNTAPIPAAAAPAPVAAGPSNAPRRGTRRQPPNAPALALNTNTPAAAITQPARPSRNRGGVSSLGITDAPHIRSPVCPEFRTGWVFECAHCGHHNLNKRDIRRHYVRDHPTITVLDARFIIDPDPGRVARYGRPRSRRGRGRGSGSQSGSASGPAGGGADNNDASAG